ncbi:MAG: MGMT family protein [Arenimonas sp.]|uniref:MGMT family protein n=1 Tax=Arenimonas sp. TaxID=1872635 RepID=UPI0025B94869|nr:MGMT family protein [Arenimonas sp.]MBW8366930.1 MGMT family protein [Arenimonas sp.]
MPPKPNPQTADERRRLIETAVGAIAAGEVAGYGEVARRAGLPGCARLVARVLAAGGDKGLPWHRVLRSDGRVAFPAGSAGFDEQVQRLRAEGVRVEAGRVRGQRAAPTLDEMLWAPPDAQAAANAGPAAAAAGTRPRR